MLASFLFKQATSYLAGPFYVFYKLIDVIFYPIVFTISVTLQIYFSSRDTLISE